MDAELKNTLDEIRSSLMAQKEEIANEKKALEEREFAVAQAEARANVPAATVEAPSNEMRDLFNAMKEKRAITVNGTGNVAVVREIVKVVQDNTELLGKVKFYYGPNAATKIPALTAAPAQPSKRAENASGITADSTAVLTAAEIDPYIWSSTLPVSIETVLMSGSNFVQELPAIFADSFAQAMLSAMMTGTGSGNMQGLFTNIPSANITKTGTTATLPTLAELHSFAVKLRAKAFANPCIIMHPDTYLAITNTAPQGYDPRLNGLVDAQPQIAGVPVYISAKAATGSTTGTKVVVGCDLSQYAIGCANTLTVRPVETPDSTSVFYKAYWAFSGTPVNTSNLYGIEVK